MGKKTEMLMLKKFMRSEKPHSSVSYEVPIRRRSEDIKELSILSKRTLDALTSWKIDAVVENLDGTIDLYEAKLKLDMKQLGQLLCYRILLAKQEGVAEEKINMHAVYKDEVEELKPIYRRFNIILHKV